MKAFRSKRQAVGTSVPQEPDSGSNMTVEDTLLSFIKREIPKVRADIQKNLESHHSPIWRFLNSALGLSILTATFITGGAALHRNALRATQEDRIAEDELMRYTSEFSYRLAQIEFYRDKFYANAAQEVSESQVQGIGRIVRGQENTIDNIMSFKPSLPEFRNKNLLVVVDRLRGFGITREADQVYQALSSIENSGHEGYYEVLDSGIAALRQYRNRSIAEALRKPRERGWVRRVLGF